MGQAPRAPSVRGKTLLSSGHRIQMELKPEVIRLLVDALLGRSLTGHNRGKSRFSLAQEQTILTLEVHRAPALAVIPELGVTGHIFCRPTKGLQFIGAMGQFLGHSALCVCAHGSVDGGLLWGNSRVC